MLARTTYNRKRARYRSQEQNEAISGVRRTMANTAVGATQCSMPSLP